MLKPFKHFLQAFSVYIVLSFYVYFTYHWLIIPLALEGGIWGVLTIVLGIAAFLWIALKNKRLPYAVFSFLLLFLDKALQGTYFFEGVSRILGIVLLSAVVWLLGRSLIRLPKAALSAVILVALFFYLLWPREDVRLWAEFRVADVTSPLYVGKRSDYFPLYLERNATTGLDRIIVYGNREEQLGQDIHANELFNENMTEMPFKTKPMDLEANKKTYFLGPEIIRPYALSWDHGRLKREPLSPQEEMTWERQLMHDYPGFPYFEIKDGRYQPLIERDALAERVLNFGQTPYLALTLDALHLADDLKARSGNLDEKPSLLGGAFTSLRLLPDHLEGYYHQKPFKLATKATQIIGAMRVEDEDVLVLLGQTLDLVTIEKNGQPFVTHRLSSQELPDLYTADYLIAPLPGEGDVLFLSFPTESKETAKILKPLPGGTWRVLFNAKDPLFRFEDVRIQNGQTTILALPTSRLSNYPQRYLAEYTYENGKLVYRWKVFYSLINVRYAKLWAENHGPLPWMRMNDEAIVGMRYGDHRLYVLVPHHLPVYPLLIGSNALIVLSLLIIRWREHLPQRMIKTKKGGALH